MKKKKKKKIKKATKHVRKRAAKPKQPVRKSKQRRGRKKLPKWPARVLLGFAGAFFLYVLLLCLPYPFFPNKVSADNISVYSGEPLPANTVQLINDVSKRLSKSAANDPTMKHRIFLCESKLKFLLFANKKYKVGGINYVILGGTVYLRPSIVEKNRLLSPSGREVEGDRTLVYYMAHELTHSLEVHKLGLLAYQKLPVWIREGYADYIGKGKIDLKDAIAKFRNGNREMDPQSSGFYLRYHLLVAYLLDVKKISTERLFADKFDVLELEKELVKLRVRR